MNRIVDYLEISWYGLKAFMAEYKYLALVIGVLLYAAGHGDMQKRDNAGSFWRYAAVVCVLLMIPLTGAVFAIYQTNFYDYQWVWSFMPLTAVLAWGSVTIIFEEIRAAEEKKLLLTRFAGVLAAAAVLFVCGNQGKLVEVSEKEMQAQRAAEQILQYMEEEDLLQESVIWAPKDIMQYLRSHSGDAVLLYGRDMWDAKAGAYDYEAYTSEEIACYEWIELLSDDHNLFLLEVEQAPEHIYEALAQEEPLREAANRGADVIILPDQISAWMERKLQLIGIEKKMPVSNVSVEGYTLWLLAK